MTYTERINQNKMVVHTSAYESSSAWLGKIIVMRIDLDARCITRESYPVFPEQDTETEALELAETAANILLDAFLDETRSRSNCDENL